MPCDGSLSRRLLCPLTLLIVLVSFLATAKAQNGYISFDVPHARHTLPEALNRNGLIGGHYTDAVGMWHLFLRTRAGAFLTTEPDNSAFSYITSVNTAGAAVGQYTDTNFVPHGFFRSRNGLYRNINIPGTSYTNPLSINDSGQATGGAFDRNFQSHGFLWSTTGTAILFDVPGSTSTAPASINASGEITGYYLNGNRRSGFIRDAAGNFTLFDGGNGTQTLTQPTAINASGQVTGTFYDDLNVEHAFLRDVDGTITFFDGPYEAITNPIAMNDLGEIVGNTTFELGYIAFERDVAGNLDYIPIPFTQQGSSGNAITNNGHMAGDYLGLDHRFHGWAN
ncbi:MAG TPA: hypothetical protein VH437_08240 [Terriglobales bacterium]